MIWRFVIEALFEAVLPAALLGFCLWKLGVIWWR